MTTTGSGPEHRASFPCRLLWRPSAATRPVSKNAIQLRAAPGVCVLRTNAAERCTPDSPGPFCSEARQAVHHVHPVPGDEHLFIGLEKELDPFPCIGDEA